MAVRKWHWISATLCFTCMLLFAAKGIRLRHAKERLPKPMTTHIKGEMPMKFWKN